MSAPFNFSALPVELRAHIFSFLDGTSQFAAMNSGIKALSDMAEVEPSGHPGSTFATLASIPFTLYISQDLIYLRCQAIDFNWEIQNYRLADLLRLGSFIDTWGSCVISKLCLSLDNLDIGIRRRRAILSLVSSHIVGRMVDVPHIALAFRHVRSIVSGYTRDFLDSLFRMVSGPSRNVVLDMGGHHDFVKLALLNSLAYTWNTVQIKTERHFNEDHVSPVRWTLLVDLIQYRQQQTLDLLPISALLIDWTPSDSIMRANDEMARIMNAFYGQASIARLMLYTHIFPNNMRTSIRSQMLSAYNNGPFPIVRNPAIFILAPMGARNDRTLNIHSNFFPASYPRIQPVLELSGNRMYYASMMV